MNFDEIDEFWVSYVVEMGRCKSENTLHAVLGAIVAPSSPIIHRLCYESINMSANIFRSHALPVGEQSVFKVTDEGPATLEAWQVTLAHEHHFDKNNDFFRISLQSAETSSHALSKVSKRGRVLSIHYLHHFLRQLERCLLELDSLAGRIGQEEAKVNVKDMALNIDQDVFIVSILNLQDVAD